MKNWIKNHKPETMMGISGLILFIIASFSMGTGFALGFFGFIVGMIGLFWGFTLLLDKYDF